MKLSEILIKVANEEGYCLCCYEGDVDILGVSSIHFPKPYTITLMRGKKDNALEGLLSNEGLFVVTSKENLTDEEFCNRFIVVDNPHRVFFGIILKLFVEQKHQRPNTAVNLLRNKGEGLSIGEYSVIGEDVEIGDYCTIGDYVSIRGKVKIGNNVFIDSNVVIGNEGFGHYQDKNDCPHMIPHIGGVTIGNNVFIGAGTTIARGTIDNTIIDDDVKMDMMCAVGHNAYVGKRTLIAGGTGIAGSAKIGEDVWLSARCLVNAGVEIGDRSFIGLGSVVTKDIPKGMYAIGFPAQIKGENNDNRYKL